jgi:hypothetical protein
MSNLNGAAEGFKYVEQQKEPSKYSSRRGKIVRLAEIGN